MDSRSRRRISALDGLRGIAAAIVVAHHSVLTTNRTLASQYHSGGRSPAIWSPDWFLMRTPLHVLWAGPEMVIVFFVLSGFVLALPAVERGFRWMSPGYLARRLPRLYIPVWGALLLAGLLRLAVARHPISGGGPWLNGHVDRLSATQGLRDATVVQQGDTWAYATVIWSLQWEVLFSLLLPVAVAVPILTRRRPWLALLAGCVCLLGIVYGSDHALGWLRYLPVFELGALLAFHGHRWSVRRGASWLGLLLVAVTMLTATYTFQNQGATAGSGLPELADILGACLIVWLCSQAPARRALESRPARWLGSRSYSLYLVHEPVIVTIVFALGGGAACLLLAVPLALLTAELTWRLVERPSQTFARRLGGWVDRTARALPLPQIRTRTVHSERQ